MHDYHRRAKVRGLLYALDNFEKALFAVLGRGIARCKGRVRLTYGKSPFTGIVGKIAVILLTVSAITELFLVKIKVYCLKACL
jgi:hypothetical protein